MVQQVVSFKTSDGKTFDNEADAKGHEAGIANTQVIEAYIAHARLQKAQAGLMRKHLGSFIAFDATYVPPAAAPTETVEA